MEIKHNKKAININNKELSFINESIFMAYDFGDIIILILDAKRPLKDILYNNVIAFNKEGLLLWEVEKDNVIDKKNPYEGAIFNSFYLVLFKGAGQRVAINLNNGKIIRNIDLITGHRPW